MIGIEAAAETTEGAGDARAGTAAEGGGLDGELGVPAFVDGLQAGELPFVDLFEGRTRPEMIGLFLALLELVKQQRIALRQEEQDATGRRIVVRLAEAEVLSDAAVSNPNRSGEA